MGEAKRRGTFEERKALAVSRNKEQTRIRVEVERRKPSPKHTALVSMMAAFSIKENPND